MTHCKLELNSCSLAHSRNGNVVYYVVATLKDFRLGAAHNQAIMKVLAIREHPTSIITAKYHQMKLPVTLYIFLMINHNI